MESLKIHTGGYDDYIKELKENFQTKLEKVKASVLMTSAEKKEQTEELKSELKGLKREAKQGLY